MAVPSSLTNNRFTRVLCILVFSCSALVSGATPRDDSTVCLELVSNTRAIPPDNDLWFSALMRVSAKRTVRPAESTLVISDSLGRSVVSKSEVFFTADSEINHGMVSDMKLGLHLNPGRYSAIWRIGGSVSNTVAFSVDRVATNSPYQIRIEFMDRMGCRATSPGIMAMISNPKHSLQTILGAIRSSRLKVGTQIYPRRESADDLFAHLSQGDTWMFVFDLAAYAVPASDEPRSVALEIAGRWSNTIEVAKPKNGSTAR